MHIHCFGPVDCRFKFPRIRCSRCRSLSVGPIGPILPSPKRGRSHCVGETLEEAKKINASLTALGKVGTQEMRRNCGVLLLLSSLLLLAAVCVCLGLEGIKDRQHGSPPKKDTMCFSFRTRSNLITPSSAWSISVWCTWYLFDHGRMTR